MSFILWITFQLALLFTAPAVHAAIVVLPSEDQTFESYQNNCLKENFLCTQTVIKEKLATLSTPKYDQFILDLDLQSPRFTTTLAERIKNVVESEMISLEQLESLINILQRSEEISVTRQNKLLKVELTQLQEMVTHAPAAENFNFFIFKKPLGAISTQRLKSFTVRPLMKEIDFKKETVDQQSLFYKSGHCSQSRLSDHGLTYFNDTSYIFADEKNCSWTDTFAEAFKSNDTGSESKYKLSSKQKNILVWSALAVGAGLFLSQYELKIEY